MESAGLNGGLLPTLLVAALAVIAVAAVILYGSRKPARRTGERTPAPAPQHDEPTGSAQVSAVSAPASRDDFLADISHELRTPLVALLGYVELLCDTQLGEHQRNYADAIAAAGSNLLDIVDDLSNLSHIESGRLTIHEQPFSLHDCVDGVAQMLAPSAYHKGLDFIRIVDAGVPARLQGDPLRVRQVLVNLITNAVKFTRSGSVRIHVSVASSDAAQTELTFAIIDTGIGIAAADQKALFQPFSRVDHAMVTQGTGLGLVIARRLCEAMNGTIGVTSQPGQGSRFEVHIPFRADADTTPAMNFPVRLAGCRIAIVCHDDALAGWLTDCLLRHGAHSERLSLEAAVAGEALAGYGLAMVFVGADLLASPDRLDALSTALRDRLNVLCLVSTSSGHTLQRVERMFGGAALPAHAPPASTCRRIAEMAGGKTARPTPAPARPSEAGALSGLRLLVAEDNAVSRDYLRIMLSRHGADVEVCSDGNQAVELVQRQDFDLVLLDARMPDCDGPTAARRIREAGFSLPVIGLTAAGAECDNAKAAGMTDCLVKPMRTEELLRTITAMCRTETGTDLFQRDFLDAEMLSSLSAELPQHAQRLTSALAQDDRAALFEEAHKLNGIASLCGFEALRRHAGELESCLRGNLPCNLEASASALLEEVRAVCEQIRSQPPDEN